MVLRTVSGIRYENGSEEPIGFSVELIDYYVSSCCLSDIALTLQHHIGLLGYGPDYQVAAYESGSMRPLWSKWLFDIEDAAEYFDEQKEVIK